MFCLFCPPPHMQKEYKQNRIESWVIVKIQQENLTSAERGNQCSVKLAKLVRNFNHLTSGFPKPSATADLDEVLLGHNTGSRIQSGTGRFCHFDSTAANKDKVVASSAAAILLVSIGTRNDPCSFYRAADCKRLPALRPNSNPSKSPIADGLKKPEVRWLESPTSWPNPTEHSIISLRKSPKRNFNKSGKTEPSI